VGFFVFFKLKLFILNHKFVMAYNSKIGNLIKEAMSFLEQEEGLGKKKGTLVKFDGSSPNPWEVSFSERGFSVDDTRLSFEELQYAISKGYSLVLKGGTTLDAIKMQKILKYKDLY